MHTARYENSNMLHLSLIKPLLGAVGWLGLAILYVTGLWTWLAANDHALAGLAALANILLGAWRIGVWARRAIYHRRHAPPHFTERKRWWLK